MKHFEDQLPDNVLRQILDALEKKRYERPMFIGFGKKFQILDQGQVIGLVEDYGARIYHPMMKLYYAADGANGPSTGHDELMRYSDRGIFWPAEEDYLWALSVRRVV